jgi:hypothetical protein
MKTRAAPRLRAAALFCALALAMAAPLAVTPDALGVLGIVPDGPICLFRRATSLPCPTCGLTRAWMAAARWQWPLAARYHPLAPLIHLAAMVLAVAAGRSALTGRALPGARPWHAGLVVSLLLAAWVVRLVRGA